MPQLLPIFALDAVLMPGAALPLHVFEPRYRQLVADVQQGSAEPAFGIVCVRAPGMVASVARTDDDSTDNDDDARDARGQAGQEAGAIEMSALSAIGTLAAIVKVEPYADGRFDLVTVGRARFRLLQLAPAPTPYLQAEVDWLPEPAGDVSEALIDAARRRCVRYLAALATLAGRELPHVDFAADPIALSYQVANRIRASAGERQALLEAETAELRLRAAVHLLRREVVLLSGTRTVPVAPSALYVDTSVN